MTEKITPREIRRRLQAVATEKCRISMQRFFKEPVDSIGVRSADIVKIRKDAVKWFKSHGGLKAALKLAIPLWKSSIWEEHAVALGLLMGFEKEFDESTWKLCDKWVDGITDWAGCDFLAADIIGAHLDGHADRRKALVKWAKSKNRWRRRAAAVSLVKHARKGRYMEDVWRVASPLMPDEDDMVRKGVGWLLREAARMSPGEVVAFCRKHEHHANRLILRTASETMSEEWKAKLLGKMKSKATGPVAGAGICGTDEY